MQKLISILLIGLLTTGYSFAQITIDTNQTPETIVKDFFRGEGMGIRNVEYKGHPHSLATFNSETGKPHFSSGFFLTTGNAGSLNIGNTKANYGSQNGTLGETVLKIVKQGNTYDAAVLEFDFQPAADSITFNFFFASEEYNEYIGTDFYDVFILLVTGPGYMSGNNLGLIPGTDEPITSNSVNGRDNSEWYIDNNPFSRAGTILKEKVVNMDPEVLHHFQFDGYTKVISVGCRVKPKAAYHLKLAIADRTDEWMDSGIFFEAGSFRTLEQAWRVRKREEQRIADSIATAILKQDSLMALAASIWDSLEVDSSEMAQVPLDSNSTDSIPYTSPIPPSEVLPGEVTIRSDSVIEEGQFKAFLVFEEEGISVEDEDMPLVKAAAKFLKQHPDTKLGLYSFVKGDSDESRRLVRLRSIHVEYLLIGVGIDPGRIIMDKQSFFETGEMEPPGAPDGWGRVELWVR